VGRDGFTITHCVSCSWAVISAKVAEQTSALPGQWRAVASTTFNLRQMRAARTPPQFSGCLRFAHALLYSRRHPSGSYEGFAPACSTRRRQLPPRK